MKFVFIEDNLIDRLIAERICTLNGVYSFFYDDPADALPAIAQMQPDVILLDQYLPGYECKELIIEIKANSLIKDIPLCILTAGGVHKTEEETLKLGVIKWLLKPFSAAYITLIQEELQRRAMRHERC